MYGQKRLRVYLPEIKGLNERYGPKYDSWSLTCHFFSEALGLKGLWVFFCDNQTQNPKPTNSRTLGQSLEFKLFFKQVRDRCVDAVHAFRGSIWCSRLGVIYFAHLLRPRATICTGAKWVLGVGMHVILSNTKKNWFATSRPVFFFCILRWLLPNPFPPSLKNYTCQTARVLARSARSVQCIKHMVAASELLHV